MRHGLRSVSCLDGPSGTKLLLWPFALCLACRPSPQGSSTPQNARPSHRVRSYSETRPFAGLAIYGSHVYAATPDGLLRFDDGGRQFERLRKSDGLLDNRIVAISADPAAGLWVATQAGVSRLKGTAWSHFPKQRGDTAITAITATKGGLWLGTKQGLLRLNGSQWTRSLPKAEITALVADGTPTGVWVGTRGEGVFHYKQGRFHPHWATRGQVLRDIAALALSAEGAIFAIGRTKVEDRIAFFDGKHWASFSVRPRGQLRWLARVGPQMMLWHGQQVYTVHRADPRALEPQQGLPIGPLRLIAHRSPTAPSSYPVPKLYTQAVRQRGIPRQPTAVSNHAGEALISTATSGGARYDGRAVRWYRTGDLTGQAHRLKLACDRSACFFASGSGRAYRYRGGKFRTVVLDKSADATGTAQIKAFARDPQGQVVALHAPAADQRQLTISRWDGAKFRSVFSAALRSPTPLIDVHFARYDRYGQLWIGLSFVDQQGEDRPWGVAVVKEGQATIYHRSTLLPDERRAPGSLALPDDVRDVHFRDAETWMATDQGVCRVKGSKVELFTENEGLESEIAYAIDGAANGDILVATLGGLGRFDGVKWRFDYPTLAQNSSRALELGRQGDVWLGTSDGLLHLKGKHIAKIDVGAGLSTPEVRDVYLDGRSRPNLWVLTRSGLAVVDPR